jgi:hypothetical protein
MMVLALLAAMSGTQPDGLTAMASRACSRRLAQLAASHGYLDVSTRVIGETMLLENDRVLVQLNVTIRYRRRMGVIEPRNATVGCIVNRYGKVEAISEPIH